MCSIGESTIQNYITQKWLFQRFLPANVYNWFSDPFWSRRLRVERRAFPGCGLVSIRNDSTFGGGTVGAPNNSCGGGRTSTLLADTSGVEPSESVWIRPCYRSKGAGRRPRTSSSLRQNRSPASEVNLLPLNGSFRRRPRSTHK